MPKSILKGLPTLAEVMRQNAEAPPDDELRVVDSLLQRPRGKGGRAIRTSLLLSISQQLRELAPSFSAAERAEIERAAEGLERVVRGEAIKK